MALSVPSVPAVMLATMGLFQVTAAVASFVPGFVHDRVPQQFTPVWTFLTGWMYDGALNESLVYTLAVASQFIIGTSEAIIGVSLLAAAGMPRRRLALANFGLGYSVGLFGAFMLTMFAMHDKSLPAWNQYPAILTWIGVTWLVVALTEQRRGMRSV
jgi:hypothetical protein